MKKVNLSESFTPLLGILLLLSYDLLTYLAIGFSSSSIKIVYYAFFLLIYIVYLIFANKKNKIYFYTNDFTFKITLFFCITYLIRVIFDLYIKGINHVIYTNRITYVYLFVNGVIIPLFFLKSINYEKINFNVLYLLYSLLIFISLLISYNNISKGILYAIGGRYNANETLDTIGYGHLGITFFLIGFYFFNSSSKLYIKFFSILIMIFGLFSAGLANSRSPLVALICCLLFYIFLTKKFKTLFVLIILFFLIVVNINKIDYFFQSYGSSFIERVIYTVSENHEDITSGRNIIYKETINNILNNPFFGKSFLVQTNFWGVTYAHNSILDAFHATGLFGGILYIIIIITTLKNAFQIAKKKNEYLFISLIFIQYLIYSMFSRSLISLPILWTTIFLVNSIYTFEKQHVNKIRK